MENFIYNPIGKINHNAKQYEALDIIGPTLTENFTLYYVLNGKGDFTVFGKTHQLEKGHIFFAYPNIIFSLKADDSDPWEIVSIVYDGNLIIYCISLLKLDESAPILKYNSDDYLDNICEEMLQTKNLPEYLKNIRLMGLTLMFICRIVEFNSISSLVVRTREELYIYDAVKYIHNNFNNKLTVNKINKALGLDRSYFSKLFRKHVGLPPQQYIIQFKIDRACEMLSNTSLGIGFIANQLGYSDYFAFSKTFKRIKGISPIPYRRTFKPTNNIESNIISR